MSLIVPWLALPLVLGLLSLGCGLLLEWAAGVQFPGTLLIPTGFCLVLVTSALTTSNDVTARLTTPIVVALAVAGAVASLPLRRRLVDGWALASAAAAYAAYGAPVFLSGKATFAGYITLDDTATWLGFTDRLLTHGRNLSGLGPSSYEAALDWYWNQNGYPVGAFPPLGMTHQLLRTDSAWLVQPYIAFGAGLLALVLYRLLGPLIGSRPLRAFAACVAAQPALLYAYALWGGVKELPAAAIVPLVVALTPLALRERPAARSLLPLATASAALVAILNFSGGVWLLPALLPILAFGLRLQGRAFLRSTAVFAGCAIALSVPSLLLAGGFINNTSTLLTKETELGNLGHPLNKLQLFGVWPVGDFRGRPHNMGLTYVLIGLLIAAAVAGVWWGLKRKQWELPLYAIAAIVGCAIAVDVGSPWVDAKALAIASPAIVAAGMAGAGWLIRSRRPIEGAVVIAAIAGGVLWSNALAYHDVWLAPRAPLRELETIGKRFAGEGPTLMNEYQPFGVRHFLRNMDPEGAAELRRRQVPLVNGQVLGKGEYADIDRFQLSGILVYRSLVLLHIGSESRPPSAYKLVWKGRYYDVWQRPDPLRTRILAHLPLGNDVQPAAVPGCGDVLRLARLADRQGGRLAAVFRPSATVVDLARTSHPANWQASSGSPEVVYPSASGTLTADVTIATAGRYGLWLGGSFRRRVELSIDGRQLAAARNQLNRLGEYTPLGDVELRAGVHEVALHYSSTNLSPGSGGAPLPLGPLVLSRSTDELPVRYVQPSNALSLCGQSLDWVEAIGS
jgi:hypothetical protein